MTGTQICFGLLSACIIGDRIIAGKSAIISNCVRGDMSCDSCHGVGNETRLVCMFILDKVMERKLN